MSYTPREFMIMLRAQQERKLDEYDQMANEAMMHRQAQHTEKLSKSDLFSRNGAEGNNTEDDSTRLNRLKENTRSANEWLAGLSVSGSASRKE